MSKHSQRHSKSEISAAVKLSAGSRSTSSKETMLEKTSSSSSSSPSSPDRKSDDPVASSQTTNGSSSTSSIEASSSKKEFHKIACEYYFGPQTVSNLPFRLQTKPLSLEWKLKDHRREKKLKKRTKKQSKRKSLSSSSGSVILQTRDPKTIEGSTQLFSSAEDTPFVELKSSLLVSPGKPFESSSSSSSSQIQNAEQTGPGTQTSEAQQETHPVIQFVTPIYQSVLSGEIESKYLVFKLFRWIRSDPNGTNQTSSSSSPTEANPDVSPDANELTNATASLSISQDMIPQEVGKMTINLADYFNHNTSISTGLPFGKSGVLLNLKIRNHWKSIDKKPATIETITGHIALYPSRTVASKKKSSRASTLTSFPRGLLNKLQSLGPSTESLEDPSLATSSDEKIQKWSLYVKHLEATNSDHEKQLQAARQEISELREKLESAQNQNAQLNSSMDITQQLSNTMMESVAKMQRSDVQQVLQLSQQVRDQEETIRRMKSEADDLNEQLESSKKKLADALKQKSLLQNEFDSCSVKLNLSLSESSMIHEQLASLQKQLAESQAALRSRDSECRMKDLEIQRLTMQLKSHSS